MAIVLHLYRGGETPIDFAVKAGVVIREELNEKRDSATAVFRSGVHQDIQPFDFAVLEGVEIGGRKTFIVDSFSERQIGFGSDVEYEVTLNLFSQTKEMERVTLPNLSITALADGTRRTVLDYILQYVSEYAPKVRVEDANQPYGAVYESAWIVPRLTRDRFGPVICPEFSWNAPTLAEVITDLMQVDDCIPVIKDNELLFIDLRKNDGEIEPQIKERITGVTRSMSSDDYNQSLRVNLTNAIGKRPSRIVEYTNFRNATQSVQTTQNLQIVTQKPIYSIKKITATVCESYNDYQYHEKRITTLDLTGNVKEQDAYNVLDPTTDGDYGSAAYYPTAKRERQIANVYYRRGENIIEGWSKEFGLAIGSITAVNFIIDHETMAEQGHFINTDGIDFRDILFTVEYETLSDASLSIGRRLPLRNTHTESFDNQGSSYVDVGQQSIFEYAKANRLSNAIIELSGVFYNAYSLPAIGQTYDGAIIFSTEAQCFDDCIIWHGYATADYVLANYFVAVRAKRRSWAIASGNEALTRHENKKIYAEFSFRRKNDAIDSIAYNYGTAEKLLSPLYRFFNDETIKCCAFKSRGGGNEAFPSSGYYILDCSAEAAGMALAFTAQFADNYSAGVSQVEQTFSNGSVRRINTILPYANSYGEFSHYEVAFLSYHDPADGAFVWPSIYMDDAGVFHDDGYVPLYTDSVWNSMKAKGLQKPKAASVASSDIEILAEGDLHKDNREVFGLTFQIEFCSSESSIMVSRRFVERQSYVYSDPISISGLKFLASTYVYTRSNLPSASARYLGAGLLVTSGDEYAFYKSRANGSSFAWERYNLTEGEKLAYLKGYERTSADADTGVAGYASRAVVYEYGYDDYADPAIFKKKKACIAKLSSTRLTPESETVDDVIMTSPVFITDFNKSARISVSDEFKAAARRDDAKAWAICDEDGKILVAVNIGAYILSEEYTTLWLNVLETRGDGISASVSDRESIVGTIVGN